MMGWGVRIGGKRLKILGYADNLMILAEDEEGIRWLITRLEKYIDGKELRLNAENTKVIRFGKRGKGRKGRALWWWKGEEIEEIKDVIYLGYRFKRSGRSKAHVEESEKGDGDGGTSMGNR